MEKVGSDSTCHHRADSNGWVLQHILVAEKKFNTPITRDFTIHHRNGNRSDNSPINLELRVGNHGKGADVGPALLAVEEVRQSIVEHLVEMGYSVIPPGDRRNK